MVWADGNTVLNKNEAYAFASCQDCQATAISFQVVLIVGQAHVVVPQNISAAVNYDCVSCLTQALAVQLVVTLPADPSPAELQQLTALWQQIQAFSRQLPGLSFAEIRSRLAGYEQQILQIVQQDAGSSTGSAVPSQSTGTPTGTSSTGRLDRQRCADRIRPADRDGAAEHGRAGCSRLDATGYADRQRIDGALDQPVPQRYLSRLGASE